MSLMEQIKAKAKADQKHILLPEGAEERTVQAAARITAEGIAKVTLFGKRDEIEAVEKDDEYVLELSKEKWDLVKSIRINVFAKEGDHYVDLGMDNADILDANGEGIGMFILIDNQYNIGDIIEVDGFRGTVTEINVRSTVLTDVGGNVKIINNSDMKNVLNRSDNSSKAVSDFPIPYETDLQELAIAVSSAPISRIRQ